MITPDMAINLLKKGNERFINNLRINRNLLQQVDETSEGQNPFAVIISCMDSRTSPELIFDQGLGDIFSLRVAGNVINEDIIGSSEFGCKIVGAKVILVLGHTQCGAIMGAVQNVSLGHLEFITKKIRRSLNSITFEDVGEGDHYRRVTRSNVFQSIQDLRQQSPILREMELRNEIQIVGGLYDVASGVVDFFSGESKDDSDFKPERNLSTEERSALVDIGL